MPRITYNDLTVERKHNGISIYATVNGYLMQRLYQGYTLKEAKRLFRDEANKSD